MPAASPPPDWLRSEIEQLREQVQALGRVIANQQSVFFDIAGARTAELHASLAQIQGLASELRGETQRLRQLEDAITHHLHDLVLDVVQPELRAQLAQGLPQLIVESLGPDLRRALGDWLPGMIASTVSPEVRALLAEWLPVMVADTVQPEVRAAIAAGLPDAALAAIQPELRATLEERLPDLFAATVRPDVYRTLGERLPGVVADAVTPHVRQTLVEQLPGLVSETVRPEVRATLDQRLPAIVAQVVSPEVRRALAERLPSLVTDTVQPELRQVLTERLPGVVADVVSPSVGELLAERMPAMLAETVTPDLSVALAETESAAAELRQEAAKLRGLRDVVAERLPESVMEAIEPPLQELIGVRFPRLVNDLVEPILRRALAEELPALVAKAVQPSVTRSLDEHVPQLVADTVRPELRQQVARALEERLPDAVADAVQPALRAQLGDALPPAIARSVTPELAALVEARLPSLLGEAIMPDVAASLSEVEASVAEMRAETARLRSLREVVADRLPETVVEAVEPHLQELLSTRFPRLIHDLIHDVADPLLRTVLIEQMPELVAGAVQPSIARSLSERVPELVAETVRPQLRDHLIRALDERLPSAVTDAVRPELRDRIGENLPGVIAQGVTPEVISLIESRLPGMLGETVMPEVAASLAEVEACAAEMRAETARLRGLREVVSERLPEAVLGAIQNVLGDTVVTKMPDLLARLVQPALRDAVAIPLPTALDQQLEPALRNALARDLPGLVERTLEREVRLGLGEALPGLVAQATEPTLRAALSGLESSVRDAELWREELHQRVAELTREAAGAPNAALEATSNQLDDAVQRLGELREEVLAALPALVEQAVVVPLAEYESSAAQLRAEAERLRALRAEIATRLPRLAEDAVEAALARQAAAPAEAAIAREDLARVVQEAVEASITSTLTSASIGGTATQPRAGTPPARSWPTEWDPEPEGERAPGGASILGADAPAPDAPTAAPGEAPVEAPAAEPPPGPDFEGVGAASTAPAAPTQAAAPTPPAPAPPAPAPPAQTVEPGGSPPEVAGPRSGARQPEAEVPSAPDLDPSLAAALAPPANGSRSDTAVADDGTTIACVLPGVVAGPTLARGISEAIGRARLRRRRRRRAGPPSAGLHRRDPFSSELMRRIEWFALARRQVTNGAGAPGSADPGTIAAGEREGHEVSLPVGSTGGLSLIGPRAREVARALVLTFLAANEPDDARAIVVGDLFPTATTFPGLGRARDLNSVLTGLQGEAARRLSLFADAGVADIAAYRAARPDERLPTVLVAAAEMTTLEAGRLGALLDDGTRTGIVGVLVDAPLQGIVALRLHGPARVANVSPEGFGQGLIGARLFAIDRDPAAELLDVLASARTDPDGEPAARHVDEPFVASPPDSAVINVALLGGFRIDVNGREVRSGLRAKAKELLAFYLLHPEGTTLEEATEALWPEADPRRGSEWFWTALGNLRSRLRSSTANPDLKVIEREGDRYRVEPLFEVDLWRFEAALAEAGANSGDASWADLLQAAADRYAGELLAGADWPWAEVPREDLRSRAVDVLVSLAATRLVAGDVVDALSALQRAVEIDPLAEQLYRRIMRLHAKLAQPEQVNAAFRALVARLGEFDLQPSPESEKLYEELCGAGT